ncbi:MAG: RNA polymerase sigma factor [Planctomycetota bacterium]
MRVRAGDEEAFRKLFERHAPALRARIRTQLPAAIKRKVSASDVIQVAYAGAYKNLASFEDRGDGAFQRWLNQIVDNKVKDILRRFVGRAKRNVENEVSRRDRPATHNFVARQASPSQHAIACELTARVRACMQMLPHDYQRILKLVQEERLSLREAGERMGRSAGACEKLYGRALSKLAELVDGDRHGDG